MNKTIQLTEATAELAHRVNNKLGYKTYDELFVNCLHLLNTIISHNEDGFTEVEVINPGRRNASPRKLTIPRIIK